MKDDRIILEESFLSPNHIPEELVNSKEEMNRMEMVESKRKFKKEIPSEKQE